MTLSNRVRRVWLTDADESDLRTLLKKCPAERFPHYLLPSRCADLLDEADEKAIIGLLGLKQEPDDAETFCEAVKSAIEGVHDRFMQQLENAAIVDHYPSGHHPSWFVQRGVRSVLFPEYRGKRGMVKQEILAEINRLIQKQALLRSTLTEKGEEHWFSEYERLSLEDAPVFDLSTYPPETADKLLNEIKRIMREDLVSRPPLNHILFNVVLVRLNLAEYSILFALDHIIGDYESNRVIAHHFEPREPVDGEPSAETPVEHYRRFPSIMARIPDQDPRCDRLKRHPAFQRFREPVQKLHQLHPIGEPIIFSDAWYLELWLDRKTQKSGEANYLGHGLAAATQVLARQFELTEVPIRVLVSRRYFGGVNFYNTIGDFHDSVPVTFPADLDDPEACSQLLQNTDRQYIDEGLNISALGREPEIYRTVYKSPLNFNYVGEILAVDEDAFVNRGVMPFLQYPLSIFHIGDKIGVVFLHGLSKDLQQSLAPFLAKYAKHRLREIAKTQKTHARP